MGCYEAKPEFKEADVSGATEFDSKGLFQLA